MKPLTPFGNGNSSHRKEGTMGNAGLVWFRHGAS